MKMYIINTLLLTLSLLAGCKDDDIPPTPVPEKSPIIWQTERAYKGLATKNYLYKDMVINGCENMTQGGFEILALSADSGKVIWRNTDWPELLAPSFIHDADVSENILVVTRKSTIMAVNLDDGTTLWSAKLENPSVSGVKIIDNWAYKSADNMIAKGSTMHRFDVKTGKREEVFTITLKYHGDNIYAPNLKLPVKWIAPNGNELLVMHNRSYGAGTNGEDRMDILAYNLTADSLQWYRKGLDVSSSSAGAAISEDKVYFYGTWHAYCINPANGKTIWKYYVGISSGGDFNTANILIVDDKLIVKQENFFMTAVNKETGEKIWFNDNTIPSPHLLTEHNDTIWMANGGVMAIDANTGEKYLYWKNNIGTWFNPVLPHPTNGLIYTTNGAFIYCLDPKYMK